MDANYTVTWGQGLPEHTVTALDGQRAEEIATMYRPWGPVILRRDPDGVVRSVRTGKPWHKQDFGTEQQAAGLREPVDCSGVTGAGGLVHSDADPGL